MSLKNKLKNIKNRKTLYFILFMMIVACCAVIFAARAAEHSGIYWIGLDNEFTVERPHDDNGFFTVDVSDFLNSSEVSVNDITSDGYNALPLAIGPLPNIPTFTDNELKLYNILSQNNGYISESDQKKLSNEIKWTETFVESGDTFRSIAECFGISEEDIRVANMIKKSEKKPDPNLVLYIPKSHNDVKATREYVEKMRHEEIALAKKSGELEVIEYVVKEGDTLWAISNKFNIDIDTIIGSNQKILRENINYLKSGMVIRIPNQDGIFVKAKANDTIGRLAATYGSTVEAINAANDIKTKGRIIVGRELFIPGGKIVVSEAAVKITTTQKDGSKKDVTIKISERRNKKLSGSKLPNSKYARNIDSYTKASIRFRWPLMSSLSSHFGWRKSPFGRRRVFHSGLDIRAPRGTPIHASASGVVVHSGWMSGYGKVIVISHGKGLATLYGHCSKLIACSGKRVSQGQVIALVGSTGRSTGNHLHFEVRVNGSPQNPLKHLR